MKNSLLATAAIIMMIAISACIPGPEGRTIEINDAWVRAPIAMPGMGMEPPGALFLVIRNRGDSADRLLGVESDAAGAAQIHLTEVDANGTASMHPVDGLDVPAGSTVKLEPGGYHIMLLDMKRSLTAGETVEFVLTFEQAGRIVIEAPVKSQ